MTAKRNPRKTSRKKPRSTAAKKRPRRLRKVIWTILILGSLVVAAAGLVIYTDLSRRIDAELNAAPQRPGAVYARSYAFKNGRPANLKDLVRRLDRLGYRRTQGPAADPWYTVSGSAIQLGHYRQGRSETVSLRLAPAVGGGSAIADLAVQGRRVERAPLKEPLLSNLWEGTRERTYDVSFADLPAHLIAALLIAEDEDFFSHPGIDWRGILRALRANAEEGGNLQGGSTLTQQFVKNTFLTPERSLWRKMREASMAVLLERRLSKRQIFELYANQVYLGQVGSFAVQGVGAASRIYFGKQAKDLSAAESAQLAAIIPAPNRYSPLVNPVLAKGRRNRLLRTMHDKGALDDASFKEAIRSETTTVKRAVRESASAPYFVDYIRKNLASRLGGARLPEGLDVYTTLDADLQALAVQAVQDGLRAVDRRLGHDRAQAALVVLDPVQGEILAMVGGRSYAGSQYNRATQALRQPGSAFKPFVFAEALRQKIFEPADRFYTLSSQLVDEPYTFVFDGKEYSPGNHGGRYRESVSLRNALALSLNVPTVKLAEEVGFARVRDFAARLGLERLRAFPAIALGTFEVTLLELAHAYTVFPTAGGFKPLRSILALDGADLPPQDAAIDERPLEPEVAYLVTSALASVLSYGTGKEVRRSGFLLPAAGKTGSTDDSWFVGFTPDLLCAVWVGMDDSSPLGLEGSQAALPIWLSFMKAVQKSGGLSGESFTRPDRVVEVPIDRHTGLKAGPSCTDVYAESYISGTEPLRYCLRHHPRDLSGG